MHSKVSFKLSGLLTVLAVVLASLLLLLPVEAVTDDNLPSLMNVEIVGDYLYWDAFDGAGTYSFGIKNSGGYYDPLTDANGNILPRQSMNLREYCEKHSIPSGTFIVYLCGSSDYGWKGGQYITKMWRGNFTYVSDIPQLAKPQHVVLNESTFDFSWDAVPNATSYSVVLHWEDPKTGLSERVFHLETSDTNIDLKEYFLPGTTRYAIYLIAHADGYLTSEQFAQGYTFTNEYLAEKLPDTFVRNVRLTSDGTLSWDAYRDATAYNISLDGYSAMLKVGKELQRDASGRFSCNLNDYCVAFGCSPADIRVGISAYNDQSNSLGDRISGFTYLTYAYGGVQMLTGEVVYSGEVRYGSTPYVTIAGAPAGVALNYEWQVHENGVWTKIASAANSPSFSINSADLIGKYIRVSVKAKSGAYQGTINGAPKLVGKSFPYQPVPTPQLRYTLTQSNRVNVARIQVTNAKSDIEYVITAKPSTSGWPTDGQKMTNGTVDIPLADSSKTYYVYARYAETATRECGTRCVGSSISIPAKDGQSTTVTELFYPEYDTPTPTIYLPKGQSITVKYQLNPSKAIENLPRWNAVYDGIVNVRQDASARTLTLTGTAVGQAFVTAYKPNENTPWYYGSDYSNAGRTIHVVVYDPNNLRTIPFTTTKLSTVELFIGDRYTVDLKQLSQLPFVPDTVDKTKYQYSAYVKTRDNMTGSPYVGETAKDGSVTIRNSVITASKVGEATVYIFAKTDSTVPVTADSYFAYFTVKVSQKPQNSVEKLTLNNRSASLRVGETLQLVATKDPVGAVGTVSWSSSASSVVQVDANGKIKAIGKGMATITAKCGTVSVTCTVEVLPAYCTEHQDVEYTYVDQGTHKWVCKTCGATGITSHEVTGWDSNATHHWRSCTTYGCCVMLEKTRAAHDFEWVVDKAATQTAKGLKHEECKTCRYQKAAVEIPVLAVSGPSTSVTSAPSATSSEPPVASSVSTPAASSDAAVAASSEAPVESSSEIPTESSSAVSSDVPAESTSAASTQAPSGESSGGTKIVLIAAIAAAVILAAVAVIILIRHKHS